MTATVHGKVVNTADEPLADAVISIRLLTSLDPSDPAFDPADAAEIVGVAQVRTRADGLWSVVLDANADLAPTGGVYQYVVQAPGAPVRTATFVVPQGASPPGGWWLGSILVPAPAGFNSGFSSALDTEIIARQAADTAEASARAAADALLIPLTQKAAANGVATLDGGSKIPTAQLPALAINDTFQVASQAAMLALVAQRGDVAVRTDVGASFILAADDPTVLGNWLQLSAPGGVVSVAGRQGAVVLTEADVANLVGDLGATAKKAVANTFTADNFFGSGRPWFDPRAFGAAADGVTDDTAAFEAILTAIEAIDPVGKTIGGNIFVPAGTYRLTRKLRIARQIVMEGAGGGGAANGAATSHLKWDQGVQGLIFEGQLTSLDGGRSDNSVIRGISLDGTSRVANLRSFADGAMGAASNILNSPALANFTADDVGRMVTVPGTGPQGTLIATIVRRIDAQNVQLSVASTGAVAGKLVNVRDYFRVANDSVMAAGDNHLAASLALTQDDVGRVVVVRDAVLKTANTGTVIVGAAGAVLITAALGLRFPRDLGRQVTIPGAGPAGADLVTSVAEVRAQNTFTVNDPIATQVVGVQAALLTDLVTRITAVTDAGHLVTKSNATAAVAGTKAYLPAHAVFEAARGVKIAECYIQNWNGVGISIDTEVDNAGGITNANLWRIDDTRIQSCYRHGVLSTGVNSNQGRAIGLDVVNNDGIGIMEGSFLGSGWYGVHANANGEGCYRADSGTGTGNVFVQCYDEANQPKGYFLAPALVLGGDHGAGYDPNCTAAILEGGSTGLRLTPGKSTLTARTTRVVGEVRERVWEGADGSLELGDGATAVGGAGNVKLSRSAAATWATKADNAFKTGLNTTANRPNAAAVGNGAQFFDTTLHKPIWSDGVNWRDATGAVV